MPKVNVYDVDGKKLKSMDLKEEVFGIFYYNVYLD